MNPGLLRYSNFCQIYRCYCLDYGGSFCNSCGNGEPGKEVEDRLIRLLFPERRIFPESADFAASLDLF